MKGILHTPGITNIKSMHTAGARSIPKVQRSSYLELDMLRRKKERLDADMFRLEQRRETATRQLDSINKRIEQLQREVQQEQKIGSYRSVPTRPVKTMTVSY